MGLILREKKTYEHQVRKKMLLCYSARALLTHGGWRHNNIGGCNAHGSDA